MTKKYRIVRDRYLGYEAQFKTTWWPFWRQCFGTNTAATIDRSKKIIETHMKEVVWRSDCGDMRRATE